MNPSIEWKVSFNLLLEIHGRKIFKQNLYERSITNHFVVKSFCVCVFSHLSSFCLLPYGKNPSVIKWICTAWCYAYICTAAFLYLNFQFTIRICQQVFYTNLFVYHTAYYSNWKTGLNEKLKHKLIFWN